SSDGKRFTSQGQGASFKLWDLTTGQVPRIFSGHTIGPWTVAFAPDGKTLASGSPDGWVRIWDVATGNEKVPNPTGHWDQVLAVAIAPDGRSVLLGSKDRKVRQGDLATGRLVRSVGVDGEPIEAMGFARDGGAVAVAHRTAVELWDVATGRRRWSR